MHRIFLKKVFSTVQSCSWKGILPKKGSHVSRYYSAFKVHTVCTERYTSRGLLYIQCLLFTLYYTVRKQYHQQMNPVVIVPHNHCGKMHNDWPLCIAGKGGGAKLHFICWWLVLEVWPVEYIKCENVSHTGCFFLNLKFTLLWAPLEFRSIVYIKIWIINLIIMTWWLNFSIKVNYVWFNYVH